LTITNVTKNEIIYAFPDTVRGAASYVIDTAAKTTLITLDFDTTSHADTDELQIFIEKDSTEMRPDKTYTDPVSKFRVSQPENLIDTDFEYGLQSTKWETLELIRNIPTFFSRHGDQDLEVSEMTSTKDSNLVRVTTSDQHGLVQGNPIFVVGSRSNSANGGFVVTKVIDESTFVFNAKANIPTTGSIKDTYTQIFLASIYQGTEFKLENSNDGSFVLGLYCLACDKTLLTICSAVSSVMGFLFLAAYLLNNSFALSTASSDGLYR